MIKIDPVENYVYKLRAWDSGYWDEYSIVNITVIAKNERDAINKAKQLVKRDWYIVEDVTIK